ncbi:MAG: ABC transporter ATP-binding protein [Ectothiorhodospiraceae bacterium]|nr:ABC transporter ATP-binding protein [Ectothiorhodospiraceae bacterium]MCH8503989.1 ABC transporter ATP-binding protein [Ectothiorhodospiraceae bacterium]
MTAPLLDVDRLSVRYDRAQLLHEVSLRVEPDQFVAVVGPNGAGKSTLLRAITGLVRWEREVTRGVHGDIVQQGRILFGGEPVHELPAHKLVGLGLIHCPERRRPFRELSVLDNLLAGAYLNWGKSQRQQRLQRVYALFPRLQERHAQIAGTLSGGEQQMLAIGRALMSQPRMLCIDEPSLGLSPKLREEVFEAVAMIREREGIPILLVEQEITRAFELADYAYVISQGQVMAHGKPSQLTADETLRESYLGL